MALPIAVVMIFSVAAIPASAALTDSAQAVTDSFNAGDYFILSQKHSGQKICPPKFYLRFFINST